MAETTTTTVKTLSQGSTGSRDVDLSKLGDKVLYRTLKEAVVMYQANRRQGTRSTKTRKEVAGSGRKPYRQKHTGRARAGSFQSPIWRGGGVVFGPRPRDFHYQLPRKMKRAALRSALLGKFLDGQVVVVEDLPREKPSTKQAFSLLKAAGAEKSALLVMLDHDPVVLKSFRNIPKVDVRRLADLNAFDVLRRRFLLVTPEVLENLAAGRIHGPAREEVSHG